MQSVYSKYTCERVHKIYMHTRKCKNVHIRITAIWKLGFPFSFTFPSLTFKMLLIQLDLGMRFSKALHNESTTKCSVVQMFNDLECDHMIIETVSKI